MPLPTIDMVPRVYNADKKLVEKRTGYVLGGVSPIGQKKRLSTVVHETAKNFKTIFAELIFEYLRAMP